MSLSESDVREHLEHVNEGELDLMMGLLINAYNSRLIATVSAVSPEWLVAVENLYFMLDTPGYGFLTQDEILCLYLALLGEEISGLVTATVTANISRFMLSFAVHEGIISIRRFKDYFVKSALTVPKIQAIHKRCAALIKRVKAGQTQKGLDTSTMNGMPRIWEQAISNGQAVIAEKFPLLPQPSELLVFLLIDSHGLRLSLGAPEKLWQLALLLYREYAFAVGHISPEKGEDGIVKDPVFLQIHASLTAYQELLTELLAQVSESEIDVSSPSNAPTAIPSSETAAAVTEGSLPVQGDANAASALPPGEYELRPPDMASEALVALVAPMAEAEVTTPHVTAAAARSLLRRHRGLDMLVHNAEWQDLRAGQWHLWQSVLVPAGASAVVIPSFDPQPESETMQVPSSWVGAFPSHQSVGLIQSQRQEMDVAGSAPVQDEGNINVHHHEHRHGNSASQWNAIDSGEAKDGDKDHERIPGQGQARRGAGARSQAEPDTTDLATQLSQTVDEATLEKALFDIRQRKNSSTVDAAAMHDWEDMQRQLDRQRSSTPVIKVRLGEEDENNNNNHNHNHNGEGDGDGDNSLWERESTQSIRSGRSLIPRSTSTPPFVAPPPPPLTARHLPGDFKEALQASFASSMAARNIAKVTDMPPSLSLTPANGRQGSESATPRDSVTSLSIFDGKWTQMPPKAVSRQQLGQSASSSTAQSAQSGIYPPHSQHARNLSEDSTRSFTSSLGRRSPSPVSMVPIWQIPHKREVQTVTAADKDTHKDEKAGSSVSVNQSQSNLLSTSSHVFSSSSTSTGSAVRGRGNSSSSRPSPEGGPHLSEVSSLTAPSSLEGTPARSTPQVPMPAPPSSNRPPTNPPQSTYQAILDKRAKQAQAHHGKGNQIATGGGSNQHGRPESKGKRGESSPVRKPWEPKKGVLSPRRTQPGMASNASLSSRVRRNQVVTGS
jgi:hypothetical protein